MLLFNFTPNGNVVESNSSETEKLSSRNTSSLFKNPKLLTYRSIVQCKRNLQLPQKDWGVLASPNGPRRQLRGDPEAGQWSLSGFYSVSRSSGTKKHLPKLQELSEHQTGLQSVIASLSHTVTVTKLFQKSSIVVLFFKSVLEDTDRV